MSAINWDEERAESGEAMARITATLGDHAPPGAQDWAVEAARPERFEALVQSYAEGTWSDDEKFALASLIFASLDERLYTDYLVPFVVIERFMDLMVRDAVLVAPCVGYWAMSDEDDLENTFRATPVAREIRARADAKNPSAS